MTYASPHGRLDAGLPGRLRAAIDRLRTDKQYAFIGLGPIADMELIMALLSKQEFLDWLRVHGTDEQRRFGAELQADVDTVEAADDAAHRAQEHNLPEEWPDPVRVIEALDEVAAKRRGDYDAVRQALIDAGALSPDDTETPIADLVRALLS